MATKGAKYIRWAKMTAETSTSQTYQSAISLSKLTKVSDNPAYNEASLYGDDALAEYAVEFKECDIDVEVTEISNETAGSLFGATVTTNEVVFDKDDAAPYGGLAYIVCKQVDNVNKYMGVFYPKAKAVRQGREFETKGESVVIKGGKLHFKAVAPESGKWEYDSGDLATYGAAKTWVDGKLS